MLADADATHHPPHPRGRARRLPRRCLSGEDDKSADELTDELAEQLERRDDSFDAEQAECYAAIIVDEVGADELQDVDLSADDLPAELESPIAAAASRATDECDLDEPTG